MGGAETLLAQLAGRQIEDGHDVSIVTLLDDQEVPIQGDVRVFAIGKANHRGKSGISALWRFARTILALRPDIVHAHMLHSNLLTRLLRPLLRYPVLVNTVHAVRETNNAFYKLSYRFLDRLADVTVFVSQEAMNRYRSERLVSSTRSEVVYNGIDLDRFRPDCKCAAAFRREMNLKDSDLVVIAIGRLTEQKDYPNLFAAIDIVALAQPQVRLVVVGDGELDMTLKALVQSRPWAQRMVFTGLRRDIPEVLAASNVLVLSSLFEGFGLVLAEAMACHVPVVSTACGGTSEVVGDAGILVPTQNPEALAEAILETLALRPDILQAQLQRARQRVENLFSIDATVANWDRIYRQHAND